MREVGWLVASGKALLRSADHAQKLSSHQPRGASHPLVQQHAASVWQHGTQVSHHAFAQWRFDLGLFTLLRLAQLTCLPRSSSVRLVLRFSRATSTANTLNSNPNTSTHLQPQMPKSPSTMTSPSDTGDPSPITSSTGTDGSYIDETMMEGHAEDRTSGNPIPNGIHETVTVDQTLIVRRHGCYCCCWLS